MLAGGEGFGESLPVEDGWADVVISNGVLNLMPDKAAELIAGLGYSPPKAWKCRSGVQMA